MLKANYHTHTVLCDGKNTAEEMVQRALDLGFKYLGFSVRRWSTAGFVTFSST